jgi:O-antigen/teichoic acid export membrane protein
MRLGRTTLLHFLSQVVVSVAGFAATFAIARLGGADVLGTYAVAVALMFWLSIPPTAIGDAVTKRLSEGGDAGRLLATGLLLELAVAVVLGVGLLLGSPLVERLVGAPVGELVALLVVSNVGLLTAISVLNGEKKVAQGGGLKTIERVVRSGLHVAAVVLSYGVAALVASHVVSVLVAAVVGALLAGVRPSRPSWETARSLLRYARYGWLSRLKSRAFGWMDTIVLAAFAVGASLIGVYEVAWNLASLFVLVANSVQDTLFPEVSELSADGNYERVHHYLNEGLVFTGVFIIPGLFGAWVLGDRVLRIYNPEFTQGATVLLILIAARMLSAYGDQLVNIVNAVDRPDVAFRINVVFVLVNLVLNVGLVYLYGWQGAAVATALSATGGLVLGYGALSRLIGRPSVPLGELLRQVLAAGLMAGLVLLAEPVLPRNHYVTVGLVFLGSAVYTLVLAAVSSRVRGKARALLATAG